MNQRIKLALVFASGMMLLVGCGEIVKGDFCTIYKPTYNRSAETAGSRQELMNEVVYDCLCLDSGAEWCD